MHYRKLIEAHELFYGGSEPKAPYYDDYMESKNWKEWSSCSASKAQIERLFRFIRSWDRWFQGDPEIFKEIYKKICPIIKELEYEKIEDANFANEELKRKIREVFDEVANCTRTGRYESTDASKILHTILPNFFVMWDDSIKKEMLGVEGGGGVSYAYYFLPKVQEDLLESIKTCMDERSLSRTEAIEYILEQCNGKTLAKLADEYNYMKYTKQHPSLQ